MQSFLSQSSKTKEPANKQAGVPSRRHGRAAQTYVQEVAFILLDLFPDVLVEEQLAQDEGAHGLHVQTLRLGQDLLHSTVDGRVLLPLLRR